MRVRKAIRLAVAFVAWIGTCNAQLYSFDATPVPGAKSLFTYFSFYVYSEDEAPANPFGRPFVKFSNIVAESTESQQTIPVEYESLQLSLLRYRDFWTLIDPEKFCSEPKDVAAGIASRPNRLSLKPDSSADLHVYSSTIHSSKHSDGAAVHTKYISESGVYILMISNCGEFTAGKVHGDLIVKNPYGFLPGIEYHKMPFYFWMLLSYAFLTIMWLSLSLRWWKEVLAIQNCIMAVLILGLLESFMWYLYFTQWNEKAVASRALFIFALLSSVVKSTLSYMLVLVLSLGWGVTRPFLDAGVVTKVRWLSIANILFVLVFEVFKSSNHTYKISTVFAFVLFLPGSLIQVIIVCWASSALSALMTTLEERKQEEKMQILRCLSKVMIVAVVAGGIAVLCQFFDLNRSPSDRWKHQWAFSDGIPHTIFLVVLIAIMFIWAPNKNNKRHSYSYNVVEDTETSKADNSASVWADDDDIEDGQDGTFWAATQESKADVVGRKDDQPQ